MPTKKQHYIPRMLLKRFTTFRVPMRKSLIYQYDKEKNIERMIDVYDACRVNNLYELRNEFGLIKDEERNLIEKRFSFRESIWNKILCKVDQHQKIDQKDQDWLGLLIVLQLMRTPEYMQIATQWICDVSKDMGIFLTPNQADRYMKSASFDWSESSAERHWILNILVNKLVLAKHLVIYYSDETFILNSSRPVFALSPADDINYCQLYLSVSKHYCLCLANGNSNKLYIKAPNWFVKMINEHYFFNDGRFIYSSESLINRKSKCYVDFVN